MGKRGISLTILVITIIVMVIIAGAVILNLERNKVLDHSHDSKVLGILDNVQHKVSEVVSKQLLENNKEPLPSDKSLELYFSKIETYDYYTVNTQSIGFPRLDVDGVFIIDNDFNVIYLEDKNYIFPEGTELPKEVISALGL